MKRCASIARSGYDERPTPAANPPVPLPHLATMRAKRPRVTHVITALNSAGGAERLLVRLLEELGDEERRAHSVVTLRGGTMAPQVAEMGVPISTLGMSGLPTPADILRLGQT